MNILEVKNLRKVYNSEDKNTQVVALKDINFEVEEGEFVAIMGESGSGKSTLLNLIATLDKQTSGDVILSGENTKNKSDKERAKFRREKLGFVYQDFSLLSSLNNRDNIFYFLLVNIFFKGFFCIFIYIFFIFLVLDQKITWSNPI